ncbi:hypothetical protein BSU04nite_17250 [Bacillus spizizenii]|nr:hypothetical protein BSU04nite_17250 [Bacillus spizizenii]
MPPSSRAASGPVFENIQVVPIPTLIPPKLHISMKRIFYMHYTTYINGAKINV